MAAIKKYEVLEDLTVFPSNYPSIEVIKEDGYEGAHRYRGKMCYGFDAKRQTHNYLVDKTDTIQFVQKNEDGTMIPGWQSEQLALILLDRVEKLNAKYPDESNTKQIEALNMYLEACQERVERRMGREVMGELKV